MNCVALEFCSVKPAQLYEATLGPWKMWLGKGRKPLGILCWCAGAMKPTEAEPGWC